MTPPRTYAEWVKLFTLLEKREDDGEALDAMRKGTIAWQSGVAERFVKKLGGVLQTRMNYAIDHFQKKMARARGESDITQCLITLRGELSFAADMVNLPAIPEDTRKKFLDMIYGQADKIQDSLDESAKRDRSGKLASIVRKTRVNAFVRR